MKGGFLCLIQWARLYGGAIAVIVVRNEGDILDQPLDLEMLPPDCFQGLLVLDRRDVEPSLELVDSLDDPDFGLPKYYTVNVDTDMPETGILTIHHSRVLRFTGRELPPGEAERENSWGASELEHIWDALQRYETAASSGSSLVYKANISTLKMDGYGEMLAAGTDEAKQKVNSMLEAMAHLISSNGILALNPEDSYETHPYSFNGLKEIYECYMTEIAGAAGIPATRLFGRSPDGMNATGESDMRNYYETIAGLQERMLRPAIERLLPVMTISCFGFLPEDLSFVFNPLVTLSPERKEELAAKLSDRIVRLYEAGLLSAEEARTEMRTCGESYGVYTKLAVKEDKPHEEKRKED